LRSLVQKVWFVLGGGYARQRAVERDAAELEAKWEAERIAVERKAATARRVEEQKTAAAARRVAEQKAAAARKIAAELEVTRRHARWVAEREAKEQEAAEREVLAKREAEAAAWAGRIPGSMTTEQREARDESIKRAGIHPTTYSGGAIETNRRRH